MTSPATPFPPTTPVTVGSLHGWVLTVDGDVHPSRVRRRGRADVPGGKGAGVRIVITSIVNRAFDAAGLDRPEVRSAELHGDIWRITGRTTGKTTRRRIIEYTDELVETLGGRWLGVEASGGLLTLHVGM